MKERIDVECYDQVFLSVKLFSFIFMDAQVYHPLCVVDCGFK